MGKGDITRRIGNPADLKPRHSGSLLVLNKFSGLIIWALTKPEYKAAYISIFRNFRRIVPALCELKSPMKDVTAEIAAKYNLDFKSQEEPDADLDIALMYQV
ncbi:hypothetical protein EMPG_17207 [Blastomyces silverae]|uniref:Uncharacterized protein n=1 Tax=Blastomyces silverae TaxID=2060906 RepID=A0A0H1B8D4_9EURO|nr:hypothetical protein EMPG_17207 [Blastomyces silverae]